MNPIEQERTFEYLKLSRKIYATSNILTVPIMILLYYLNYKSALFIFVIFCILDDVILGNRISKMEKQLGLDY